MAQVRQTTRLPSLLRPLPSIGREIGRHLRDARLDLAILAALLVVAAVTRLVLLGDIPPGLHGDEATAGLEARNILNNGHIGAFSRGALGTPAGTFYWTAAVFWLFGDSDYTLRLAYAIMGIVTIPLAYLAFKVMFSRPTATIAALLLAVSAWHIHYSRLAFPAVSWPLVEVATMFSLFLAIRYESRLLFGLTGVFLASGIYSYGAYPIFVVAMGAFLAWLALVRYRQRLIHFVSMVAVMGGMALLVGLPMASFARNNSDVYTGRYQEYSITNNQEYEDSNLFERGRLIAERELDYLELMISEPVTDGADAAGVFPLINGVFLTLIIGGVVLAFIRWRSPAHAFLIIATAVILLAPAVTVEAQYRRTVGLTPFLVALAALPLTFVLSTAHRLGTQALVVATVGVVVAIGATGAIDLYRYFNTYDDNQAVRQVLAASMAEASRFMADQSDDTYVYFSSAIATINFESRRFIAPDVRGEDRSNEFGTGFRLEVDQPGNILFLFMDVYLDQADVVEQLYPGGERRTVVDSNGIPVFNSYFLERDRSTDAEQLPRR